MHAFAAALLAALATALYEDQAGEFDWTLEQIGVVTAVVYWQRRVYALATARRESGHHQSLVVALNSRGKIEWRRPLPLGESGDSIVLTSQSVATLSGGGRFVRAWRLGDGALLWDTALPGRGSEDVGLIAITERSGASKKQCAVVALTGNLVSALSCESGANKAGWPWHPQIENDSRLAAALASANISRESALRLTGVMATSDGRIIACGVVSNVSGAWIAALGDPLSTNSDSSAAAFLHSAARTTAAMLIARSGRALPVLVTVTTDAVEVWDAAAALAGGRVERLEMIEASAIMLGEGALRARLEPNSAGRVVRFWRGESGISRLAIAATAEEAVSGDSKVNVLRSLGDEACGDKSSCLAAGVFATPASAASGSGEAGARIFWAQVRRDATLLVAEAKPGGRELASGDQLTLPADEHGGAVAIFPHVFETRDAAPGELSYRAIVVTAADTVAGVAAGGKLSWIRNEALASIEDVEFVEAPLPKRSGSSKNVSQEDDDESLLMPSLSTRLALQARNVAATVANLGQALGLLADAAERKRRAKLANAERYGFDKLAIARTRPNRLFAIAAHTGDIVWSYLLLPAARHRVVVTRRSHDAYHSPEVTVFSTCANGTSITRLDAHTRTIKEQTWLEHLAAEAVIRTGVTDSSGRDVLIVVGGTDQLALSPATDSASRAFAAALARKPFYYFLVQEADGGAKVLRSFQARPTDGGGVLAKETGEVILARPPDEVLLDVATTPVGETVSSKAHILGDDAILLKYLNPHLAAVCVVSAGGAHAPLLDTKLRPATADQPLLEPPSLYVSLIDVVASKIVARVAHPHGAAPCRLTLSENWVVYSYWNSKAKRTEVGSLTLHEGMFDRYGLSPFKVPEQESTFVARSAPSPVVLYRTFALDKPLVTNLAPTLTSRGIASKHFLLGIAPGQILALDRRALDPRRPSLDNSNEKAMRQQRKKFERELDEGLTPYAPFLPLMPRAVITYSKHILNLRRIWATPTKLESTTIVFAAGLDVHSARHTPSGAFDLLADDFRTELLIFLLFGLGVGELS